MPRRHALAVLMMAVLLGGLAIPARPAAAQSTAIEVTPDQFGINDFFRAGEITPLRMLVEASADSGLDEATSVWVQWEVPNVDGDIAEYGRPVTVTRGRPTPTWLYAPLSPDVRGGDQWLVRVFAYEDEERGRELGGTRLQAPGAGPVPYDTSLLGVLGSGPLGLNMYALPVTSRGSQAPTAHEDTRVAFGIRPGDLPDRWEGLRMFDALVWSDMPPGDLTSAGFEALREWIRRGGHLVIVLPDAGNRWGLGEDGRTGLHALLPTMAPTLHDAVPLADVIGVLCKSRELRKDMKATLPVHSFGTLVKVEGKDARSPVLDESTSRMDNGYEPLIALPDGRIVAVQRLLGFGRITLLGIDITNGQIRTVPLSGGRPTVALPQPDVLWNRILGRRQDTPTNGELRALEDADRFNFGTPRETTIGSGDLFVEETKHSGQVGTGLLVATVLFIAYWVVATVGAFATLKHMGQVRHSWLVFAGAAGVFTAIAWVSVAAMREGQVQARHVTFLDYIARYDSSQPADDNDPQFARATSWMSLYVPGYAPRLIDIASEGATGPVPSQRDLLLSWSPPGRAMAPFPNVDRYLVDVRVEPDEFQLPTRSTATMLEAHWLGGLDPDWGDMIRIDPANPLRIEIAPSGQEELKGSLVNNLPGRLKNTRAYWIQSRRMPQREYVRSGENELAWITSRSSGKLPNLGRVTTLGAWDSGTSETLQFDDSAPLTLERNLDADVERFRGQGGTVGVTRPQERLEIMRILSLYGMLTPPPYTKDPQQNRISDSVAFRRLLGRDLDLSPWFTRPCLIVIGVLEDVPLPIPLRMGNEPVMGQGVVVVRWICPLPLDVSDAFRLDPDSEGT